MVYDTSIRKNDWMIRRQARFALPQYEKIINQGLSTMGNKTWLPATSASGKITAQYDPGICQSGVTKGKLNMIIIAKQAKDNKKASQKRLRIRGTSMKKFDRSTSFFVAPQVML